MKVGGGGGGVFQVFTLKGIRNEINRNDCTVWKICTFISNECINSCSCVNLIILSYSAHKEPLFKYHTSILFPSCRVWTICFINQSYTVLQSCKNPLGSSEWKCPKISCWMSSSARCAFLSLSLYLFYLNRNLPVVEPRYCCPQILQLSK